MKENDMPGTFDNEDDSPILKRRSILKPPSRGSPKVKTSLNQKNSVLFTVITLTFSLRRRQQGDYHGVTDRGISQNR